MHEAWDTIDKLKSLEENPLVDSGVIGKALSLPSLSCPNRDQV